jgi:pimeloyl-ACP methyl ester carboxylesterase
MQLVRQFIDVLGIAQAPVVGHSMSGTAGLGSIVRNPDRIEILPNSGHFTMLDEPNHYLGLIRSFFEQPPPQN